MDRLIYSSLAGVSGSALPRYQLNNEIANMSTTGFKRSFANASQSLKQSGPGFDTRFSPSNVYKDQISLAPGPLLYTGKLTDIAMNDSTVLGVSAPNGDLAFTRRGDLRVNSAGLVETGAGHAVRGQNGPISVPAGYLIEVAGDGSVYVSSPNRAQGTAPVLVGRLLLRDASQTPLERREDGLFRPESTGSNGNADIKDGRIAPSVSVQNLEGSNVSPYDAMVRLLEMNRTFEAGIKIVKEAKSIDESGASMMKAS